MIITPGADRPCTDLANPREVREFVAAKRRRGERIRATLKGVAEAVCLPPSGAAARAYLDRLRAAPHWGEHLRQLDELERAFGRVHARPLPAPRKIRLNADVSLTLHFRSPDAHRTIMLRIYERGAVAIIGGSLGATSRDLLSPEVIRALSIQL